MDGGVDAAEVMVTSSHDPGRVGASLAEQNMELRGRLDAERAEYRRKLNSYHDEQQRQALTVQKLHDKVATTKSFGKRRNCSSCLFARWQQQFAIACFSWQV